MCVQVDGNGSGDLLPFDTVQLNMTGAHLLHRHDSHGLNVHEVHEGDFGGSDFGGFSGVDCMH